MMSMTTHFEKQTNDLFPMEGFLLCLLATSAHALLQSAANKLFDSIGCGSAQCARFLVTNPSAVVPCGEFFRCGRTSSIVAIHIDVTPVRSTGITTNRIVDFNALADDLGSDLANLASLALTSAGLDSTLPLAIGRFTALTSLNLTKNDFVGALPATLTNLKLLRVLDLSHNNFSSSIDSLSALTTLDTLYLHENSFGPTIKNAFFTSQFQPSFIKLFNNTFKGAAPLRITAKGTCEFQFVNDRNCFTSCNVTTCCQQTCASIILAPFPPTPLVFAPTPLVLAPTPVVLAPTPCGVGAHSCGVGTHSVGVCAHSIGDSAHSIGVGANSCDGFSAAFSVGSRADSVSSRRAVPHFSSAGGAHDVHVVDQRRRESVDNDDHRERDNIRDNIHRERVDDVESRASPADGKPATEPESHWPGGYDDSAWQQSRERR
jgi:hypothetical protein